MERDTKKFDQKTFQDYVPKAAAFMIAGMILILFYFTVERYEGLVSFFQTANTVLMPFIVGFIMAFLMNPIMEFFEKYLSKWILPHVKEEKKKSGKKHIRLVSSILSIVVLIGLIVLFFVFVTPQMISSISYIVNHLEEQLQGIVIWADEITRGIFHENLVEAQEPENIHNFVNQAGALIQEYLKFDEQSKMIDTLTSSAMIVGRAVAAFLIGLVAAVYILNDKEKFKGQVKKVTFAIFKPAQANILMEIARKAREIFYGFIVGKIIDSVIVGVICYISLLILRMPYPVLVAVIIGVTNVIPVFGPYIGAVPTVAIIFFTSPTKGIIFLVYVLILQQVDGNIIGPKILGDSTGLSSFWVLFAIVVGNGLFGILGMLIGVPLMALIYYSFQRIFRHLTRVKGLPTETKEYLKIDTVDPNTGEVIYMKPVSGGKKKILKQEENKDTEEK